MTHFTTENLFCLSSAWLMLIYRRTTFSVLLASRFPPTWSGTTISNQFFMSNAILVASGAPTMPLNILNQIQRRACNVIDPDQAF